MLSRFGPNKNERGLAIVEMAIVMPLLVLVFLGVAEFGFVFKQKLLVSNAVQTATRTGSSLGQNEVADMAILDSIQQGFSGLPGNGDTLVTKVTVYKAQSDGTPVPGSINTYRFTPQPSGCDWTPCPTTEANIGGPWLPSLRNVDVGDLDHIGVSIFYGHDWILGQVEPFLSDTPCNFDGTQCWVESAVLRLEPVNQ
jgi:hypothetical protein